MKEQTLTKEKTGNGQKKGPETKELVLTVKQAELLTKATRERNELQQLLLLANQKEMDLSTLILDAHDVEAEKVADVALNQEQTILTVTMK